MDDFFGVDITGRLVRRFHEGESRLIPPAQAQVLEIWDKIGLDWKWKNAESGRSLLITRFLIDLDTATLSLSPESIDRFALAVAEFLSTADDRRQPLRKWRQLCGWANWALSIRPYARPLLTPVFAKLARKDGTSRGNSPFIGVFLNNEVREALQTFVEDLVNGPPLNLKDPGLTEWAMADADLLIHTDACLETDEKRGSGLGFWYDVGGSRYHFFSRPPVRYERIQFAETLTVAFAVRHALARPYSTPPRRIMVRTDSAPAVYAFDSGKAKNTEFSPLRHLILLTFIALRKSKVDLRVHHISGVYNTLADNLSRQPVFSLIQAHGNSLSSFLPPPDLIGGWPV